MRRTIFWSYERGSWPYDVMVVLILAFVCLTPRHWFHDGPRSGASEKAGIQLTSQDFVTGVSVYRVDAKSLPAAKRTAKITPELEREVHDLLERDVAALAGRTFQILRIVPRRAEGGPVLDYSVTILPQNGM
ncbi:MAG TPA: hypothetical protein VN661_03985 [Candidatus Acidoferrales bacterium]|nr:hypothetical protein [Candidatus Acidoferrales bacterium]